MPVASGGARDEEPAALLVERDALGRAVRCRHVEDRAGEGAMAVTVAAAVVCEGDGPAGQRADGDQNGDRPQSLPHRC
jgi:hypothetical protein